MINKQFVRCRESPELNMKELFTILWTEVTSWRPFTRTMRIATVFEDVGQASKRAGWRVHSYVLMKNHYHLLVETPGPNLSVGMQ